MKRFFKRAALVVSVLLLVLVLTVGGYIAYLQIQYYRIEDNTALEVYSPQTAVLQLDTPYKAVTCNIGFGAYGPEYSFFMDTGTHAGRNAHTGIIRKSRQPGIRAH